MNVQEIQAELVGIHDAVSLVQGTISTHQATQEIESFGQASSVLNEQARRIVALIESIEAEQE